MKIRCTDIQWDTDGEEVDLPAEAVVEAEDEDYAADALSDEFGWCVSALNTEILED